MYTDTINNKSYFLILKTYKVDDLKLNVIKANQNFTRYDKFIIEESHNGKHLKEYYCKLQKMMKLKTFLMKLIQYLKDI